MSPKDIDWAKQQPYTTHIGHFIHGDRTLQYKDITDISYAFYNELQQEWKTLVGSPRCDTLYPRPDNAPVMSTFTAFCQASNGSGTIWINETEGRTIEEAIEAAIDGCAYDWATDVKDIHCLGLIPGVVSPVYWEDID